MACGHLWQCLACGTRAKVLLLHVVLLLLLPPKPYPKRPATPSSTQKSNAELSCAALWVVTTKNLTFAMFTLFRFTLLFPPRRTPLTVASKKYLNSTHTNGHGLLFAHIIGLKTVLS